MPTKALYLGKSGPDYGSPISPMKMSEPEEYFPCLHLELPEGTEFPEEGVLTVKFRVSREVEDKRADSHCVDLDIVEIQDVKATKVEKDEYAGDVLDKLRTEAEAD
jgi:hypothetical protein